MNGLPVATAELKNPLTHQRGSDPDATACGAGNPPNPDGYSTSYLWEQVWERHAWLDILNRFGSDDLILEWLAA